MALYLPRWATDCLKRADKQLAASPLPLALYERRQGAMRLVALDERAVRAGLSEGQSLSDARALCPELNAREIDRAALAARFADFADWQSYASPIVAVLDETAPYGDLVLDITGVAHLFGGEAAMLETVTGRLRALGFAVCGAVADSVGAAWALAHFSPGKVVSAGENPPKLHEQSGEEDPTAWALADLPVAALRITDEQAEGLVQMGLKRIGQLYGRERRALQARFGASLLLRLDQALGAVEERVTPRLPLPERYAERRFAEPVVLMDDVLLTAGDLAIQLAGKLAAEGAGAQAFHLFLYRVDHQVMTLSVNAGRASRDAGHIARLFAHRVERLSGEFDAGFGIEAIRLAATSVTELAQVQVGAFETDDGAADLDRLYDRMASRLGPLAVTRQKFVNSHIPERAAVLEPVVARTDDDPAAAPDPGLPRPLRLLPQPEEIAVVAEVPDGPPARMDWRRLAYRFVSASGPERIGVEWWQPGEGALTRDYYIAEDAEGRRFWLFREGLYATETGKPRWFLHGLFS